MKVIAISGKAQHGKDTTASFLKNALEADGNKVLIAHYGDLVKYVCKTFFGWDGNKDEYGRSLLQRVGTDIIRKQEENYWVGFVGSILKFFPDEWDWVLIPDCRFHNEVDFLKSQGFDLTHLRVVRENFTSPLTIEQQNHPSETALDNVEADYYIVNDGTTGDLQEKISKWVTEFNGYHQMSFDEMNKE